MNADLSAFIRVNLRLIQFRNGAGLCREDAPDHSDRDIEWYVPEVVDVPLRLQVLREDQRFETRARTARQPTIIVIKLPKNLRGGRRRHRIQHHLIILAFEI